MALPYNELKKCWASVFRKALDLICSIEEGTYDRASVRDEPDDGNSRDPR